MASAKSPSSGKIIDQPSRNDQASKIEAIIAKRQPIALRIESVRQNLSVLYEALGAWGNLCTEFARLVDGVDTVLAAKLRELNFTSLQDRIAHEQVVLDRLKARYSRETLNVGVVGRARQGKSRLLQSISGLTATEIPDNDGGHCTGVRSVILHDTQQEPHARIFFYSEQAFLEEIILPYFRALNLGREPLTLDSFGSAPLPALSPDVKDATSRAQYEHLVLYQYLRQNGRKIMNENRAFESKL